MTKPGDASLRCDAKLHGIIVGTNIIEIKCNSRFCGAQSGIVVLHRFDVSSGLLVETKKYRNPKIRKE
jgi:hypothetical protein